MENRSGKETVLRTLSCIEDAGFFAVFFVYIWFAVDTRMIYHGGGIITNFPMFFRGWEFLNGFIYRPGGITEYLSAFLSQFFYYSWSGAAVITVQTWLITLLTNAFLKTNNSLIKLLRFVPALLILVCYNQYAYYFLTVTALLIALFSFYVYTKTGVEKEFLRFVLFLLMSVILYYIIGGVYLLFAFLCGIYELFHKQLWRLTIGYFLCAAIICYTGGVILANISIRDAYTVLTPLWWKIISFDSRRKLIVLIYSLYVFVPAIIIVQGLLQIFAKTALGNVYPQRQGVRIINYAVDFIVIVVIFTAVAFLSHNRREKIAFDTDYYAAYQNWPAVIKAAKKHPNSFFTVVAANRAMFHMGRLGDDMLNFPQSPHTLLLSSKIHENAYWDRFDLWLELGYVNMAEIELIEGMERYGASSVIYQRLAMASMAKRNISQAKVYLSALNKTLFHHKWAKEYLDKIESDPNLANDQEIMRLRSLMLREDKATMSFSIEETLKNLLQANPKNKMAFEYLMCFYLLCKDLDSFIQNLSRLNDFDYKKIPQLYEEAILIYESKTGKAVPLGNWKISEENRRRFVEFCQIRIRFGSDQTSAIKETINKQFLHSYLFYFSFR